MRSTVRAGAAGITAVLALPAAGAAQPGALDPQCAALASVGDRPLQDACQKSVNIFALVAPQLGPGIAGGNALLGSGAALAHLPVVVLAGEVGRASGGRVTRTFNTFDGQNDRARRRDLLRGGRAAAVLTRIPAPGRTRVRLLRCVRGWS